MTERIKIGDLVEAVAVEQTAGQELTAGEVVCVKDEDHFIHSVVQSNGQFTEIFWPGDSDVGRLSTQVVRTNELYSRRIEKSAKREVIRLLERIGDKFTF